ncbi:hypothetical protein B0T22DRAFT_34484 [Podospora appendiculata]|uniref:Uncharacterized protein n=1 Tax=Podospora appendiculata TaxID=314037 RepID=A0AAE1CG06_9PEZI|nr:hypothetical protein B0T22DRAFT_34484 [Podospora appendiculata]
MRRRSRNGGGVVQSGRRAEEKRSLASFSKLKQRLWIEDFPDHVSQRNWRPNLRAKTVSYPTLTAVVQVSAWPFLSCCCLYNGPVARLAIAIATDCVIGPAARDKPGSNGRKFGSRPSPAPSPAPPNRPASPCHVAPPPRRINSFRHWGR